MPVQLPIAVPVRTKLRPTRRRVKTCIDILKGQNFSSACGNWNFLTNLLLGMGNERKKLSILSGPRVGRGFFKAWPNLVAKAMVQRKSHRVQDVGVEQTSTQRGTRPLKIIGCNAHIYQRPVSGLGEVSLSTPHHKVSGSRAAPLPALSGLGPRSTGSGLEAIEHRASWSNVGTRTQSRMKAASSHL